jgi:hypothetical protein
MIEKQIESGETAEKSMAKEERSETVFLPMKASMDDMLRASRIVMDKGGTVRFKQISAMFGPKKSDQNLLGYALNAAVAFGILEPHKGKAPYILSNFGQNFLTADNEQQKKMLLPKFLAYPGYKDIFIAMRNSENKSMKKQTITDMWIKIGGGKLLTRKLYTVTFASVGAWCEAIEDTGQTCVLKKEAEKVLSQILKGEELKVESNVLSQAVQTSQRETTQTTLEISRCPICNKADLIVNERYLDKVPTKGGTLLILERTYQCQGCSIGTLDLKSPDKDMLLASCKKAMTSYLKSEKECWSLWSARIKSDSSVAQRISDFVVKKEDLKKLIETDSVRNSLLRSLRTVNVEILKRERGEYASRKVKEILENAGFVFEPYAKAKDIKDLESAIKTCQLIGKTSNLIYTSEKLWKEQDKRFDFVLISKNHIQFVIETNYFTTSMSKIREVVRHFIELKKACRKRYRLIYITDGMGWFGLAKDVKRMLEFEIEELRFEPSRIPFLMNLEIFKQNMDKIKAEM